MTAVPSRDLSRREFRHPSRRVSRLGANGSPSSIRPGLSPGLSPHDPRSTRILELRLHETPRPDTKADPTHRDLAILQELDSHRYLDREHIQTLFFPGPRSCQYRLRRLVDVGLVNAWQVTVRPGRLCRASVYLLSRRGAAVLAEWRDADPRPFLKRAEHAMERHFHLVHQLEANRFFVDLAAAARELPDAGLYNWVGEHEIAAAYAEDGEHGPTPDGWGRLLADGSELLLHLEWDRGTEQLRRLQAKLLAYQRYFADRPQAGANHVLLVMPTPAREAQVQRLLRVVADVDREWCCRFWTTSLDLLATDGPLGSIWSDGNRSRDTLLVRQGLPRSGRPVEDCIGKPAWWLRRPGGGAGA